MYITLACIGAIMHNYESKKSSLDKKYDSFLLQHADFNNNGHVSLDEQLKFEEGFFNSKSVGKTYNKSTIPLDTLDTWINNYQK